MTVRVSVRLHTGRRTWTEHVRHMDVLPRVGEHIVERDVKHVVTSVEHPLTPHTTDPYTVHIEAHHDGIASARVAQ